MNVTQIASDTLLTMWYGATQANLAQEAKDLRIEILRRMSAGNSQDGRQSEQESRRAITTAGGQNRW
jgi:hypothetical protein